MMQTGFMGVGRVASAKWSLLRKAILVPCFVLAVDAHAQAGKHDVFADMLMNNGIEAYSQAGQRGDQATADALLDVDVLFSGGDGAVERDAKRDKSDAVAALIKSQTSAFELSGLKGDLPAMQRYADHDLLMVSLDGKVASRLSSNADLPAMPAGGVPLAVTQSDWAIHHDDHVAVASHIESRKFRYGSQELQFSARVLDTWIARGSVWKLLAHQAIALHQDVIPTPLSNDALDAYVGAYWVGEHAQAVISRDGNALLSSINGAKPTRYEAETRDVFYVSGMSPGSARTRIFFQREGERINGYASSSGLLAKRIATASDGAGQSGISSIVLPAKELIVRHTGKVAIAAFIHERVTQFHGQELHTQYRSMETWVKRGDQWKMLSLQSRALEHDAPGLHISSEALQAFAGNYVAGADMASRIALQGNALLLTHQGDAPLALHAVAGDYFAVSGSPRTGFIFKRDANGQITGYIDRCEGRDLVFTRVGV